MAQHKYDEFYRLLVDAHVVTARAVREAEALGLSATLDEITNLYNGVVKIANNVMTKIEADHIATLIDNDNAPSLASAVTTTPYRSAKTAVAQSNSAVPMTPHFMYMQIDEERHHHHGHTDPTDCSAAASGPSEAAADPGCDPT